jgi:hypothetical protein
LNDNRSKPRLSVPAGSSSIAKRTSYFDFHLPPQGFIEMPRFVIERDMPHVGALSAGQIQTASQGTCKVLRELGPGIQWVHSYVTADKIYCIYMAPDAELIRKHAEMVGFPADSIAQVRRIIDPTTGEA